jgi:phospholipase/carboxylesterase
MTNDWAIVLLAVGTIACRPPAEALRPVQKPARPTLRSITAGATGGAQSRKLPTSDAPVLVLLHGFASRPSEWLPISERIGADDPMLFVFPEGPEVTTPPQGRVGGRAWWRRDRPRSPRDRSRYAPPGMVAARARVIAFLDQLEAQQGIDSGRVILGGFSQGAVLALDVALHDPRSLRGLALLSGTIVNERDWFARLSSRRGLPVFVAHSPQDTVLPFVLAQRLRLALVANGWQVTWRSFEGGHAMPAEVIAALGGFARASGPPAGEPGR